MPNILIINGHQPYPFSEGRLNAAFAERARTQLTARGHAVRTTEVARGWDIEAEVAKHQWADTILLQFPANWMGVPWSLKKYMDEVYTAGMDGRLCVGDGRSREDPARQYGTGGTLSGRTYMLSLTFNAPAEAFGDPEQYLFGGRTVDDLMWPQHMNFRFFGMTALPTFAAHDVMKNPDIEADFARFAAHLDAAFGTTPVEASNAAA